MAKHLTILTKLFQKFCFTFIIYELMEMHELCYYVMVKLLILLLDSFGGGGLINDFLINIFL